jgi:phosphohistidine phosphatase
MRPLSARGRDLVEALAARAAARGVKPDVIWHSGKLRARQTADAFRRLCNPSAVFSATRGLQSDDPPHWIADMLLGETRSMMLVGHMPHLPLLRHLLVTGGQDSRSLDFPLNGMVELEGRDGKWVEVARDEGADAGPRSKVPGP